MQNTDFKDAGGVESSLKTQTVTKKHVDWARVAALYESAFPKEERVSLSLLRFAARRKGICFTAYYDGGEFCGFTYSCETSDIFFVFFLAVEDGVRGKGYGSRILTEIKKQAGSRPVALNVEPPDPSAANNGERLKRLEFYRKNGFYDTGLSMWEVGGKFNVLSTSRNLDPKSCKKAFRRVSYGFYNVKIKKLR